MSIEILNLSKSYGEQKALKSLSFSVHPGELVGFLGPNGAGKSTTMKIITGYLEKFQGTVKVCGLSISKNKLEAQKKIGYLPEHNPLYKNMYVKEYLGFCAAIHKISKKQIEHTIEEVGLQVVAAKKIHQLSKGYQQRVGLAAALLHNPEVLILDEPTTGLDPNQLLEIRLLLKKISATKTVLFSSHILQEIEAICNRVVIINKGEIVADKKIEDFNNSSEPKLEELFRRLTN